MILDSQEQKEKLLALLDQVPMNTTMGALRAGQLVVDPEVGAIINAVVEAEIAEAEEAPPGESDGEG
ncbi:MAG: hypothetical protein KAJ55_00360 [Anaerolineales bacterium]|nr:hypothetical protein [Anaerolineales bacterium]